MSGMSDENVQQTVTKVDHGAGSGLRERTSFGEPDPLGHIGGTSTICSAAACSR